MAIYSSANGSRVKSRSLALCRSNYRNSQVGLKRGRVTKGDTYDANNTIRSNRGRWWPGAANFSWSHTMVKIDELDKEDEDAVDD